MNLLILFLSNFDQVSKNIEREYNYRFLERFMVRLFLERFMVRLFLERFMVRLFFLLFLLVPL